MLNDSQFGACTGPKAIQECPSRNYFTRVLVEEVLHDWQPQEQLIFYFSGHGEIRNDVFGLKFGPNETDFLSFNALMDDLQAYKVSRAIIIIDACHAGAAINDKGDDNLLNIVDSKSLPKGIAIIGSSRRAEVSQEFKDGGISVFTHLLVEGVRGGLGGKKTLDGLIHIDDIVTYINNELDTNKDYQAYEQRSSYKINGAEGNIWLAKNVSGSSQVERLGEIGGVGSPVTSLEELRLLYESTQSDKHPCPNTTFQDLDWQLIEEFLNKVYPNISSDLSKEEILAKLNLYSPIPLQGKLVLHKSAILCFAQQPELFYEQAKSVFVVGSPSDINFVRKDITGPLSQQVAKLIEEVTTRLETVSYIAEDGRRRERLAIDERVVRELISNAITHRDYDISGTVTVTLTNNALEVRSPGKFLPEAPWPVLLNSEHPGSIPLNIPISHFLANLVVFEGIGRGFVIFRQYLEENGDDSIICHELPGPITLIRICFRSSQSEKERTEFVVGEKTTVNIAAQFTPIKATSPPPPAHFIGRREHLKELAYALTISKSTDIIALQGMSGIGKTATALQLAAELSDDFPGGVFWGSLPDHKGNIVPILRAWGRACGQDISTEPDQAALVNAVRNLLTSRRDTEGRLLVIVDDVRREWLEAANLLKQVVPTGMPFLMTTRNENLATVLGAAVHRLDQLSLNEALELLKRHAGSAVVEAEQDEAEKLLEVVGYLPLAIELAGKRLKILARKPGHQLATFGETVAQRATQALTLDGHPGVSATFAITYEAMDTESQRLFRWLGVFAAGPLYAFSMADILERDKAEVEQVLDEFVSLALLSWGETPDSYTLHPLLREYAQNLLMELGETEVMWANEVNEVRRRHLTYYLSYVQENTDIDPIAYDRLEAALPNLLSAVDFAVKSEIYEAVRDFGYNLYGNNEFLAVRGYSREAVDLLAKSVTACRKLEDRQGEGTQLGNLGIAYSNLGQVEKAIGYYGQALAISQEIGDRRSEGVWLGNLGQAYRDLGEVEKAIGYHEQALAISQEIGDRRSEGVWLGNLGIAYSNLGQVEKAIGYYEQALAISQEIGDRRNEGVWLDNLGQAYRDLGEVEKAIGYHEQALAISQEIGDRRSEGVWLGNLGIAYSNLGQVEKAIGYYEQALAISRKIGDRRNEGVWLGNLGQAYRDLGEVEKAIGYYEQALAISQEIGYRQGEGSWLGDLGIAYSNLGQVEKAIGYYEQALAISQEIGHRQNEGAQLGNLGIAYSNLGQVEKARKYLEQSFTVFAEGKLPNAGLVREWLGKLDTRKN